jgi:hypothetical protein
VTPTQWSLTGRLHHLQEERARMLIDGSGAAIMAGDLAVLGFRLPGGHDAGRRLYGGLSGRQRLPSPGPQGVDDVGFAHGRDVGLKQTGASACMPALSL